MKEENPVELLIKKRDGYALAAEEIAYLVQGYLKDEIADYQMSAFLMACFLQGLNPEEISALTQCYIESGGTINFDNCLPVADKHSTGGVGDKISLMLAPIAASLGLLVPMISGRGLGHTGGTLDKLESISGFRTSFSLQEFKALVENHGFALAGQSSELVPADKKIYALRDVTATVESPGLITASIMSKKIAEGTKHLVIDLKIGSGAFMPNVRKAKELAELLMTTGKSFGQKVTVVFSNMNAPLGHAVGNALEMIEAIEYLKGNYLPDTYELTTVLTAQMLISAGKAKDFEQAKTMIDEAVASGKALEKLKEIIIAQGGEPKVLEDYSLFASSPVIYPIIAKQSGWVHKIDCRAIGYALVHIKAGRKKVTDTLDYGAGAMLYPKIGDEIKSGDKIGEIHCADKNEAEETAKLILNAYQIADTRKDKEDLILEIAFSEE
ncbi:MAG TPA: thymidine phosphorylase [Candidatus Cloacimonas sp.]|nr:thymidine phosphorylase [Candidatus Cloacimonas sp.]HPS59693.1 thymidine phosphorylase [Candidatus Cloacimonas sp.]